MFERTEKVDIKILNIKYKMYLVENKRKKRLNFAEYVTLCKIKNITTIMIKNRIENSS